MKGLIFIVTDKCNITCDFCALNCGPEFKCHLNSSMMIKIFDRLNSVAPIPVVVFSGGEPTLFLKDLLETIKHIRSISDVLFV